MGVSLDAAAANIEAAIEALPVPTPVVGASPKQAPGLSRSALAAAKQAAGAKPGGGTGKRRGRPPGPRPTPAGDQALEILETLGVNTRPERETELDGPELHPAPEIAPAAVSAKPGADLRATWDFIIETYRNDPVGFVEDMLGVTPDTWQAEVMRLVAAGERRISIRAGHGVGKTAVCSWLVIWQLVVRFPQKTIVTAPTESQLMNALFPEIRSWMNKLPEPIKELYEIQSDRIRLKAAPDDCFVSAKTSSAERPEAMAGVHCEAGFVLLICDEASAIPDAVFTAAAGSMAGWNCCTILIGNPTRNTGKFHRTHHEEKQLWKTMRVSCLDCKRVPQDFLAEIEAMNDEDQWRIRVLGEFALHDSDTLIPAELVDGAMERDVALNPLEELVYGLDVARFGSDRTVLCKRQGNVCLELKSWSNRDTMETVGRVAAEALRERPAEICVDSIGVGGGVADRLRELGFNVRDVNVSESAALNPFAAKLRDELWLSVKDWLATRVAKLPKHTDLRNELCAPTYTFNGSGQYRVEPKELTKRRLKHSPDYADALCMTFAGRAALVGGRASKWISGKPLRRNLSGVV
jgi:phage terminase large subunit